MDVTRSNFQELLPDIEDCISGADFICIDGEFTGLRAGRPVNAFDSPSEYYHNVLSSSSDFLLVQFGLCAFRWDKEAQLFRHGAFNFYLFPRSKNRNSPGKIFSCQSSSLEFLADQKFDFNKLFYEGISYLSTSDEVKMRDELEEKNAYDRSMLTAKTSDIKNSKEPTIPIPPDLSPQIADICKKVSNLLEENSDRQIELENLNAFVRKLVYQEMETRFPNKVFLETVTKNQKRILCISKAISKEDMKVKVEEKISKEWEELEEAVGFSQVIRKISKSGKLVVGHSILLDLLHILNHFFSPLPENYQEFKEFGHSVFPRIIDTMYLASLPEFKDSIPSLNLNNLHKTLSEKPYKIPPIGLEVGKKLQGYLSSDSKFHEAAFDAYTTGLCLVSMFEYMAGMQHLTLDKVKLSADSPILRNHVNKIFLFKTSPQGSPYMNLSGKDMNPSRDHVFHMVFPKEWKRNDIFELFSPFGGVFVSFLDETSAFVGLRRKEQTNFMLTRLGRKNSLYSLTPFLRYKAAQITTIKEQCSSRTSEDQRQPVEPPVPKRKRIPSENGNKDPKEDLGEPISRALCPPSPGSEVKRRRSTSGGSSDGAAATPKRRRTPSGLFTVTETEDVISKKDEKGFNENDNWD